VLAPPALDSFTLLAERATVVQFKFFPFTHAAIPEWYSRLSDLAGGVLPEETGSESMAALNEAFYALPDAEALDLMRKYGASRLVTTCRRSSVLVEEYANARYCVYRAS
jgi:hypothetical protein